MAKTIAVINQLICHAIKHPEDRETTLTAIENQISNLQEDVSTSDCKVEIFVDSKKTRFNHLVFKVKMVKTCDGSFDEFEVIKPLNHTF